MTTFAPSCGAGCEPVRKPGFWGACLRLADRLLDYCQPIMIYTASTWYLIVAIITRPHMLFNLKQLQHEWFRRFFGFMGPTCANKPSIFSTLGGLLKTSSGVLVDIGPGLGDQLTHLTPCVDALDRVYALEPSVALHPQLRAAAKKAGLTGKYVVLPAGAQPQQMLPALEQVGVAEGDVDRVFSVFSVCSVPPAEVEPILRAVQRLLKPGGEYVFVEHVANHSDKWSAAYQWVLDLTWPFFMGGCRLRNNMHVKLQQMPGWESVDIKPIPGSQGFEAIPFVSGRAVKA